MRIIEIQEYTLCDICREALDYHAYLYKEKKLCSFKCAAIIATIETEKNTLKIRQLLEQTIRGKKNES